MAIYNKSARIPRLNTLQIVPANKVLPAKYNVYPMDQGFFYQHLRTYFQLPVNYCQKLTPTDTITYYFDCLAPKIDIVILDEYSNIVATVVAGMDGVLYPNNNDSYFNQPFYTFFRQFTMAGLGLGDGFYYLATQAKYGDDDDAASVNTIFVSECMHVRASGWDKTMLLEYFNDENDYDVLFQMAGLDPAKPFQFRVEADIDIDPGGHSLVFEDMFYQSEKLQEVPFRVGQFMLGDEYGVPPWVRDKVNRIMGCSMFMLDGVQWKKQSSSSWSWKNAEGYAMKLGTIQLLDNPDVSEWEYNNSSDPDIPTIHDTEFDEMHD